MCANRRSSNDLDSVEEQGLAKTNSSVIKMSPKPAREHSRDCRIARQISGQRFSNVGQGNIAVGQGVKTRHPIRGDLLCDETDGVFSLHILRERLAEVFINPVVATGEIRSSVRLRQRLDDKAGAHRCAINPARCFAAQTSRAFGLGGLSSASANRI